MSPCVLSREATNTNFIVFGLIKSGLKPTIYHTKGKNANHYTTDVVIIFEKCQLIIFSNTEINHMTDLNSQ